MLKKVTIILISLFLITYSANAGSDGELNLNRNNSETQKTNDCFEKLNRVTFAFNQGLDEALIEPIAKGYRKLPSPIQTGIGNFLNHQEDSIHFFKKQLPSKLLRRNY